MKAIDYFAIQNLLNRYFQYVDAGDFESCGQLFAHADLIYTQSGEVFSKDPEGIMRKMREFVKLYGEAQTPRTHHQSGNMIIDEDGDNRARTSCSAIIYQSTDALPFQAIAGASYQDRFKKHGKNWVFTQRKMALNFIGDMRHHLSKEFST